MKGFMLFEFELTPELTFLLQIFSSIVEETPSTKLKTNRVALGKCALIHKTL